MEVCLVMKQKKVSVRISEEEEAALELLKKAYKETHQLELTDSELIRQAIRNLVETAKGRE